ncbi:hypothetical protein EVAR_92863_1 [Eumeta japonica]|uniref:Uncharacterized protein n=1 Tax=Eumeta variegata TaxID=151549 RepID=A0A4C1TB31_EUMVA|nr:hypothetical protein EVAR_92863_1 [Eumeta japonica]
MVHFGLSARQVCATASRGHRRSTSPRPGPARSGALYGAWAPDDNLTDFRRHSANGADARSSHATRPAGGRPGAVPGPRNTPDRGVGKRWRAEGGVAEDIGRSTRHLPTIIRPRRGTQYDGQISDRKRLPAGRPGSWCNAIVKERPPRPSQKADANLKRRAGWSTRLYSVGYYPMPFTLVLSPYVHVPEGGASGDHWAGAFLT